MPFTTSTTSVSDSFDNKHPLSHSISLNGIGSITSDDGDAGLQPSFTTSTSSTDITAQAETMSELEIMIPESPDQRILHTRSWRSYSKSLPTSIDIASLDTTTLSWAKFGESMKAVHSGQPDTPVELSIVGRVDGRNSELRPHAGYMRPNRSHCCLAAAQLRLVMRASQDDVRKRKFHRALQNLDCLMENQRVPSIGWKADGVTFNEFGDFYARDRRVAFQHRLFKALKAGDSIDHKYADKFYIWGTAGWPVRGEYAIRELKEMVSSRSHIISALKIEGCYLLDIDSPEEYDQYFAGRDVVTLFLFVE
ncbi:hypothetical protein BT96DRAFT_991841 [Gymnopus androsaceus JB14]|uniref:Uncharacterized protein n=1 Tax=Gymnopus androsaceus JB14 TaxID=1447944 RepID=A0A6A4HYK9_9AGAR|nr:hypothetical protein BT96DRAFT_991841 [Gymnopus androsaceus JB14]